MATVTKYPTIVVNDSNLENHEQNWSGLANIKANDDTDANCVLQGGTVITGSKEDDPTTAGTSGSGSDWYDPGAAADGSTDYYADVYAGGGEWSKYLNLGGMSFNIPTTASNGVANIVTRVKVEVICRSPSGARTMEMRLISTGGTVSNPASKSMPTSKSTLTFDYSAADWGLGSSRANYTGLSVRLRIRSLGSNAGVYFVKVTVYYESGTARKKPNGIYATGFGFDLNDNAKVNSCKVEWEEYIRNIDGGTGSVPSITSKEITLLKANNGANVSKTSSIAVSTSRTQRSITFVRSEMPNVKRANIENSDFGVYLNLGSNQNGNQGKVYLDYLRIVVDHTDPTYSLAAELSNGKTVGEQLTYKLTLQNTNSCHEGVAIPVTISLPSGLSVSSSSGNGSYNSSTGKWSAVLDGNLKAVLTLVLNTSSSGVKTITAGVDGFSTSLSKSTTVLAPVYTLSTPNPREIITETYDVTYTITVSVNTAAVSTVDVNIPIPSGMQFVSASGAGSYTSSTGVWSALFTNKTATLSITLKGITAGVTTQTITTTGTSLTKTFEVLPANLTTPCYEDMALPEEILRYLVDGEIYTISCWGIVTDTALSYIYPGEKNFAFSIINGDNEYISTKPDALNTLTRLHTSFVYNKDAPIKIRMYGQWLEINPANASNEFGGFAIYHEEQLMANPNLLTGTTARENVSAGSDITADISGAQSFNGGFVESSAEWAGDGERSWHITLPGSANNEAVYFLVNNNDKLPVIAGENRTTILKVKGTGTFQIGIVGRNESGTTTNDFHTINVTASEIPKYIIIDCLFTKPETRMYDIAIWQMSTPNPVNIYIDQIKTQTLNPLENIEHNTEYTLPAMLFDDPDLLLTNGEFAMVNLSPGRTDSGVLFPNIEFGGLEQDSDVIIKGIEINGEINIQEDINMTVNLLHGTENAMQSVKVLAGSETFKIGGERDKWGLNSIKLEDLEFILIPSNIGVEDVLAGLRNISITIHYMFDQTGKNKGFTLDGVHSREFNIYLSNGWDKPDGLNNDLKGLKLTRSDGEFITASTVTSKEFKIPFQIVAATLEEANGWLKEITAWMTPKRDKLQKPITKSLVFDWDAEREFNVILNDVITFDAENFECQAKFIVPEGVGKAPEKTTGGVGRNNSLIPVRPVLTVLCDGDSTITVRDSYTGQYLKILNQFDAGTVLTIDCQKRTVTDGDGNSFITMVSFDSYWFKIFDEYNFIDSEGCIVQTVQFREAV